MLEEFREIVLKRIRDSFKGVKELDCGPYTLMKYPKLIPLIKFHTERYEIPDFGHLFIMKTDAMGKMLLITASFMPDSGKEVPYLLIALMEMGQKRTVFVEYYNCTGKELDSGPLEQVAAGFSDIPDYAEKPAWYVDRRMKGSLIKAGEQSREDRLLAMIRDSLEAYLSMISAAGKDPACLEGLASFRDEMLSKGNPSSGTLNRVLGKEKAEEFFRTMVMPLADGSKSQLCLYQ